MEKIRLSSILFNLIWFSFNLYLSEVFWCPKPRSVSVIHGRLRSWGDTSESVLWAVEVDPKLPGWTLGIGAPLECWPVDSAQPLKTFARNYYLLPLKRFSRKWKVNLLTKSHHQSIGSTQDQKPNAVYLLNSCGQFARIANMLLVCWQYIRFPFINKEQSSNPHWRLKLRGKGY